VRNSEGQPAADAKVLAYDESSRPPREGKTGPAGTYSIGGVKPGPVTLLVVLPHHALKEQPVTVPVTGATVDISAAAGKLVRGTVVDSQGNPVPNAVLASSTWHGHDEYSASGPWVTIKSDAAGRFSWDGGPTDAVTFVAEAPGMISDWQVRLRPDAPDQKVTL